MRKYLLTFIMAFCLVNLFGMTNIYGQESEETVKIYSTTDKEEYSNEDDISLNVTIENNSLSDISVYEINNDSSYPLTFAGSENLELPLIIKAGGTSKVNYVIKQNNSGLPNDEDGEDDNTSEINQEEISKPNKDDVDTGVYHRNQVILLIILMASSLVIVITIVRYRHKRKILMVLLCISTSLGSFFSLSKDIRAAENQETTSVVSFYINNDLHEIKTTVRYEIIEDVLPPVDETTYTRAEWINNIITAYGLEMVEDNDYISNISDISDHPYKKAIITAEAYGIIDNSSNMFNPDGIATREFAASTTNSLLGFLGDGIPNCQDANQIQDKTGVYFSLKQGYMNLENGFFNPNDALNYTEGEQITNYIISAKQSTNCSKEITEIVYSNETIVLNDIKYSIENSKLVVEKNKQTEMIKTNDIVSIDDEILIKVLSVTEIDNSLFIEFDSPEMTDAFSSILVSGRAQIDWETFDKNSQIELAADNQINIKKIDVDKDNNTFICELDVYGQSQTLVFSLDVNQKMDIDVLHGNIENLTFIPIFQSNMDLQISTPEDAFSIEKTLVKIPFDIGPVSIDIPVVLYVDLAGNITLDVDANYKNGFQVLNNDIRFIRSTSMDWNLVAEASLKTQLGLVPTITLFQIEGVLDGIYTFGGNIRGGFSTDVTIIPRLSQNINVCADLDFYAIADYEVDEDCYVYQILVDYINPELKEYMKGEIFNKDNSPIHGVLHYEDWILKEHCTFDGEEQMIALSLILRDASSLALLSNVPVQISVDDSFSQYTTNQDGIVNLEYYTTNITDLSELKLSVRIDDYLPRHEVIDLTQFEGTISLELLLEHPEEGSVFNPENGHYYKVYDDWKSWYDAKEICEQKGGHLATITSESEQAFIESNKLTGMRWIGLHLDDSNTWAWVTGESYDYSNWGPGEPNNSSNVIPDEGCVAIWPITWNDLNAYSREQKGYLCEWE